MTRSFRLDIGRKLFLGYLPLAVLIAVTAVGALRSLEYLRRLNTEIVEVDVPLIEASGALTDALLSQEFYGRRYLILGTPDMLEEFWRQNGNAKRLVDRIRTLVRTPDERIERLAALHREYDRLFLLDVRFAEQGSHAAGEYSELSRARHKEVVELAGVLTATFRRDLQARNARAAAFGAKAFQATAILCGLGLLVGFGAAAAITRNISRSIRRLKDATDQVAAGRFDDLPAVESHDELGDLSAAFGRMAQELKRLEELSLDASPLTRLPGGAAIHTVLDRRMTAGEPFAFCLVDLDNFKAYNDRYGYARGSEVIQWVAGLLGEVVGRLGGPDDFLGHVGGDDFVILTTPDRYEPLCREVLSAFDAGIASFYAEDDRRRGSIVGKTRQGQVMSFPVMTVSIAVVTSGRHDLQDHLRVGEVAAELKDFAKAKPRSCYVVDRRTGGEGSPPAGEAPGEEPR